MSASTISLTPNPGAATRRRAAVEKKSTAEVDSVLATPAQAEADAANNLRLENRERERERERDAVVRKPLPSGAEATATAHRRAAASGRKVVKPPKSKLVTVSRILTKNLLLLLVVAGLVQIVRKLVDKNAGVSSGDGITEISADWELKFSEMDYFMKKTSKMIQVQVDVIDRKLDKHIESVKEEMWRRDVGIDRRLSEVRQQLEREFGGKLDAVLSKKEFEAFVDEYSKGKGKDGKNDEVNLDDVRVFAKEIVEKEIEKHASDGLGRVDYALFAGGGRVVKHSEPFVRRAGGAWNSMLGKSSVHPDSEKMLTPSFGEPGKCFALKGSSGYVTIRLRTAIVPEAITIEHVAKSVAYDRSSAPKDCRVSGWFAQAEDLTDLAAENEKMFLLAEFIYDLEKSNAQTFKVLDSVSSTVVDTIRFDYDSNHGSSSHTCVYRLRVHGHEPSISMLTAEP